MGLRVALTVFAEPNTTASVDPTAKYWHKLCLHSLSLLSNVVACKSTHWDSSGDMLLELCDATVDFYGVGQSYLFECERSKQAHWHSMPTGFFKQRCEFGPRAFVALSWIHFVMPTSRGFCKRRRLLSHTPAFKAPRKPLSPYTHRQSGNVGNCCYCLRPQQPQRQ